MTVGMAAPGADAGAQVGKPSSPRFVLNGISNVRRHSPDLLRLRAGKARFLKAMGLVDIHGGHVRKDCPDSREDVLDRSP